MKKTGKVLCILIVAVMLMAAMSIIAFAQNGNSNGLRLRDGSCRNIAECVYLCVNDGICPNECVRVRGNRNRGFNRVVGGGVCNGTGINNGGRGNNCRLLR